MPAAALHHRTRWRVSVAQSCPTLRPHGLQPVRLLCPWDFSRQEYWRGLPLPSPGHLPNPGIEPGSPALQAKDCTVRLYVLFIFGVSLFRTYNLCEKYYKPVTAQYSIDKFVSGVPRLTVGLRNKLNLWTSSQNRTCSYIGDLLDY